MQWSCHSADTIFSRKKNIRQQSFSECWTKMKLYSERWAFSLILQVMLLEGDSGSQLGCNSRTFNPGLYSCYVKKKTIKMKLGGSTGLFSNMFDIRYWRCVYKKSDTCPDKDINFYLYTPEHKYRKNIDVRNPYSLTYSGWDPDRKNVIIIHGFNGTEGKTPMSFIRDAYLKTGDYNVLTVDWGSLTHFPCYLSSISNTRLVAQCTAQLYSFLTASGASAKSTTCIGHSLGAHICGMMNNHLTDRMHKIVGLDPARPLVDRYGDEAFRLTKNDANVVQIIHTNAGALGETSQVGDIDFCVNGGRFQPSCKGHRLRRARCSHFLSACYFAMSILHPRKTIGVPCTVKCPRSPNINIGRLPGHSVVMGEHTPDHAKGHYCVAIKHDAPCPFD